MDGANETERDEATTRPARRLPPRWLALSAVLALLLAVGAVVATALRAGTADDAPAVVRRDDPAADLLGWLPATDEGRRAFAVWVDEGAVGATPPAVIDVGLQESLGFTPFPRTLGLGPGWRETFGWAAGDVTAWAAAGERDGIAVLAGDFDLDAVRDALERAGYRPTSYRGASLYVLRPAATPAADAGEDLPADGFAVGLLAGRLITAPTEASVRAAIDAAVDEASSLADDPAVAGLLRTAGPSAGLAAIDAADLAAVCAANDPTARAPSGAPSGRYVAVAYGRAASDGARQTLVLATFGDAAAAQEAAAAWEYGWADAVVALGDVASPASSYATLATTGAAGEALIARFADGRAGGWAPLALRFASPVCAAVADLTPSAPPVEPPVLTAAERRAIALAALPDAGEAGAFVFADLAATGEAREVAAPTAAAGQAPEAEDVAAWQAALQPLPALTVVPADPAALAQLPLVFGIGLDELHLVAEATTERGERVGVFVGPWDAAAVERALLQTGYEWARLGDATIFAAPTGTALPAWAPTAWANVALVGDRLLLSPSSGALREVIAATSGASSLRADLLAAVPDATAGVVVGGEAARRVCADRGATGQTPAWTALAVLWTAAASGDRAALAALTADGVRSASLATELEGRLERVRVVQDATGTPEAAGPLVVDALGYDGTQTVETQGGRGAAVVAAFAVPAGTSEASAFFPTFDGGCALAGRP